MRDIQIQGGEILADLDERSMTGLLLPYGEEGRTNAGRFKVMAGDIAIPADPSVVSLNVDHDRFQPIGRATRIWEQREGIMATFSIGRTPEGDRALEEIAAGTRRCLSAEFKTGIKDGRSTGGVLAAAAQVVRGAFPSAEVLAEDTPEDEDGDTIAEEHTETVYTNEYGKTYRRAYDSETTEKQTEAGTETTTVTTITEEETDADAEVETEQETEVSATVQLPKTPGKTAPRGPSGQEILASIATLRRNPLDAGASEVLAALSDIKLTGTGALPAAGVLQPNWLGQLELGTPFVREVVPLLKTGTDIHAGGKKAFKFNRGTSGNPTWGDGTWAGNKTEINSGVGFTTTVESALLRYARGADIGREFFDLPGGQEVIEAYLRELVIDHAQWSDAKALALIVQHAGTPVAPTVYPGVDGHDYAGAMGQLIQGILAVKRRKADGRKDTPTFAIANDAAYEELIYTPKDLIPEFVSFDVNTDGTATADGKVHVINADTGIKDTASVIVGADYAIELDELAGGPLHVDALELAKGGIDKAVHGYLQTFVARPEAIVHIGTADTEG
ncbi:hypothetical protein [uncultured Microbacterium sp.]|uniref:hypothetical protein n=1 Tax=uncultured Microbacterium sp. TaxID=191216 RepID=UPI002639987F|nr:hypothetical protein [uncultured Microbacterium sp.]